MQLQKSFHKASDINVQLIEAVAHHAAPGALAKFTLSEAQGLKATVKWWEWSSAVPKKKKKKAQKNQNAPFIHVENT